MKEDININFESHLRIIDKTQADRPKTILSARLLNDRTRLNNTQEGNENDKDTGTSKPQP